MRLQTVSCAKHPEVVRISSTNKSAILALSFSLINSSIGMNSAAQMSSLNVCVPVSSERTLCN